MTTNPSSATTGTAPAVATPTITYAMSPGQAVQGLYDYSNSTGMKQWIEATKPLDDKPYDGSSKGLSHFLSKLSRRALDSGWGSITKVQGHDIFSKYGLYTVQDARIEAIVRFHFDSDGVRITTRDAQASWQMMSCLMNSCSAECLNKVRNSSDDHKVTSTCGEVSEDGPLFLRILISRVVIDNRSTVSYYSHKLTCLDQLMIKVNYDVTAFNDEVQDIIIQLQSRGETIPHLMVNLFKGYEAVEDKEFVSYIRIKKYEYNEGGTIDADKLMSNAENQYMEMIRSKEWNSPPKENQEILALTAEIKSLKDQYLKGEKGNSSKSKDSWKKVEPKEGESLSKAVKGKTFHWCTHHKAWVIHKPSECRLGLPAANVAASTNVTSTAENAATVLATALAALRLDES